jgi:hypothetical protein
MAVLSALAAPSHHVTGSTPALPNRDHNGSGANRFGQIKSSQTIAFFSSRRGFRNSSAAPGRISGVRAAGVTQLAPLRLAIRIVDNCAVYSDHAGGYWTFRATYA